MLTPFASISTVADFKKCTFIRSHTPLLVGAKTDPVSLRLLDEIGGKNQALRIKTATPLIVVLQAILDEPAVVAADGAGKADLLLLRGQGELAGLTRAVIEPKVAENQVAGLAGDGKR